MDFFSVQADIFESKTEDILCEYERLVLVIRNCIKEVNIPLVVLITKASKWRHISKDFNLELSQAKTIDCVFDLIRIYVQWYQTELLDLIVDFPSLKESVCLKRLSEYKEQLKIYFESRVQHSTDKSSNSQMLTLPIDDAWDKKPLYGQLCKKTCKQIALVLGQKGRIIGHLDGKYLHITIS